MKHSLFIAFFLCLGSFASAQQLTSPDGNLSLELWSRQTAFRHTGWTIKANPF